MVCAAGCRRLLVAWSSPVFKLRSNRGKLLEEISRRTRCPGRNTWHVASVIAGVRFGMDGAVAIVNRSALFEARVMLSTVEAGLPRPMRRRRRRSGAPLPRCRRPGGGTASARRLARRSAWLDHDGERLPLRGPCVLHRRPEGSTRRRTSFGRISAFVFRAISTEAATGRAAMVQAFGRMSPRRIGRTETITALYPLQVAPARSAAGIRSGLATIAPSPSICRGSQSNLDRGYRNPSSS